MASDPEAQAQLARLLRDEHLRVASQAELQQAVDAGFETLVDGIVAEAAASDDVIDQATAEGFVRLRLAPFETLLTRAQSARLLEAVQAKIQAW